MLGHMELFNERNLAAALGYRSYLFPQGRLPLGSIRQGGKTRKVLDITTVGELLRAAAVCDDKDTALKLRSKHALVGIPKKSSEPLFLVKQRLVV